MKSLVLSVFVIISGVQVQAQAQVLGPSPNEVLICQSAGEARVFTAIIDRSRYQAGSGWGDLTFARVIDNNKSSDLRCMSSSYRGEWQCIGFEDPATQTGRFFVEIEPREAPGEADLVYSGSRAGGWNCK